MYANNRYNKLKHVVAAVLYAAILLTEAGEFFVSNYHKIQIDHDTQVQYGREIPEHIPEKYESITLKITKVCVRGINTQKLNSKANRYLCRVRIVLSTHKFEKRL